ncbi:hypothetical protein B0J15DRAFT_543058 [Fusarium solani]|jgi:hypothetical protein|uniref:Uncharacterized protein n=1 Tax=Fusarium solani TaxID=169388 RepID=A0A9P9L0Q7_FUSSL|nr:uncharacterized protein B0J15DRAFT_543058 [Fusarium solani]KAH7272445.1 hypothetical protein B0J15DRAFT_543058 [Fusarium solani]
MVLIMTFFSTSLFPSTLYSASQSTDEAALAPLLAFKAMGLSELLHCTRSDKFDKKLAESDFSSPACLTPKITKTVRHMRVDVEWPRVLEIKNLAFHKRWDYHPETTRQIVSAVRSRLHAAEQMSLCVWFYAEDSFQKHWWKLLGEMRTLCPPYAKYLTEVRTDYSDLTYNNLGVLQDDDRPAKPVSTVTVSHNDEHRTVTLIADAAGEQQMVDDQATRLREIPIESIWTRFLFPRTFYPSYGE